MGKILLRCRRCAALRPCWVWTWTVHEHKSKQGTQTSGQCDDCLEGFGVDKYCEPPPEQNKAQARSEAGCRDRDRGEP